MCATNDVEQVDNEHWEKITYVELAYPDSYCTQARVGAPHGAI